MRARARVCVCVCVCVCMYVRTYIYIYTNAYTNRDLYAHVYMCTHGDTCIPTNTGANAHIRTCTNAHE